MDIWLRASVRAGALIAEGQENGTIAVQADGGRPAKLVEKSEKLFESGKPKPVTLTQLGITRDQSSQWQQLAGIPVYFHRRLLHRAKNSE
jgi:hypothetical protein